MVVERAGVATSFHDAGVIAKVGVECWCIAVSNVPITDVAEAVTLHGLTQMKDIADFIANEDCVVD
ncbi:unnamed protein product [Taenia asiatica]|uniref:Isochorismatase domain-containing protein n=1 Tax=Taenia asiatica TaxID=60517 RepID=A0A0R3W0D9_TAEAS|nr:unnamed protein product [Taenia asiatica]